VATAWIVENITDTEGEWIPAVVTRRKGADTLLASEFVSILQPYTGTPFITSVKRLPSGEGIVAIEVCLQEGRKDLLIAGNRTNSIIEISDGTEKIEFLGDMLMLRRNKDGSLSDIAMLNASLLRAGEWYVELAPENQKVELQIADSNVYLQYGSKENIKEIKYRGKQKRLKMTVRKD
jgi:hypothetical protein